MSNFNEALKSLFGMNKNHASDTASAQKSAAQQFYEQSGLGRGMYSEEENIIHKMDTGKMKYNHELYIECKKTIKGKK